MSSNCSASGDEVDIGTNSASLNDSLERNWEYFENLRRCYDPDNIIISPPSLTVR